MNGEKETARPRGMDSAKVMTVIITEAMTGRGAEKEKPPLSVTAFHAGLFRLGFRPCFWKRRLNACGWDSTFGGSAVGTRC